MAGMFDDLIPVPKSAPAPSGMFDDLVKVAPGKDALEVPGDAAPWEGLENRTPEAEGLKAAAQYTGPAHTMERGTDRSMQAMASGVPIAGALVDTPGLKEWESQHPTKTKIMKAVGAIAGTALMIAAAPEWFGASAAQSLPERALGGAIGGGGLQGLDTFARTLDPEQALHDARIGAEWGAAAPLVAEPIVNALGRGVGLGGRVINSLVPGTRINVDNRLLTALDRQNMTPTDLQQWEANAQAAGQFPGNGNPIPMPTTLADSGPAMRDLAAAAKRASGNVKTEATNVLDGRQQGAVDAQGNPIFSSHYERMSEATRRALQVTNDNMVGTEGALAAGRTAAANAAYDAFRNSGVTIPVDDILQAHAADMADKLTTGSKLFQDIENAYAPFTDEVHSIGTTQGPTLTEQARYNLNQMQLEKRIATALEAGDEETAKQLGDLRQGLTDQYNTKFKNVNLTAPSYDLSPAKFDAAKQQLDDMIGKAVREGDNYKTSLLTDLKNRLVARADAATTVQGPNGPASLYQQARNAYATPTQTLEAMETGNDFQGIHPDRIAGEYQPLNTAQRRAYRLGAADALTQQYGDAQPGHNVTKFIDTPNMQNRLAAMTANKNGSNPRLDKLNALADVEDQMKKTQNRVMGGSPTDENRIQSEDFTLATRIGDRLRQGNFMGALTEGVMGMLSSVYRFREMDAQMLARDLLNPDPAQKAATIARLSQRYGQRQTQLAVNQSMRMIGTQIGASVQEQMRAQNRNALAPNGAP